MSSDPVDDTLVKCELGSLALRQLVLKPSLMKDMLSKLRTLSGLSCPLVLLAVIGCDPSSAKKYDLGRPLPDV